MEPVQELRGVVKLPGSKSLSNRILLLAALADGTTEIENLLVRIIAVQLQKLSVVRQLHPCIHANPARACDCHQLLASYRLVNLPPCGIVGGVLTWHSDMS